MKEIQWKENNLGKRKVFAVALGGFMLLSLGTGAVFAQEKANADTGTDTQAVDTAPGVMSTDEASEVTVTDNNGKIYRITADGKTWSEDAPEGVTVEKTD